MHKINRLFMFDIYEKNAIMALTLAKGMDRYGNL